MTSRRPIRGLLEIHSATRLNITLEQYKKAQKFRLAVAKLLEQLPEASRNDPEVQFLAEEARVRVATLVQLKYQSSKYEPPSKNFVFSGADERALASRSRRCQDRAPRSCVFPTAPYHRGRAHLRRPSRLGDVKALGPCLRRWRKARKN